MVVEISPGTFQCERPGCQETVIADKPNNKRSRAQAARAIELHEQRNAIHVSIVDLSTMPPNPEKPDAKRSGFAVILATTKGIEVLSRKISGRAEAEAEASIFMHTLASFDDEKQRGRNRLPKTGSVVATQKDRDNNRHICQLLAPPVIALKQ